MSKRDKRTDWPRCPALKRDETPCGSATRPDAFGDPAEDLFCKPHAPAGEQTAQETLIQAVAPAAPEDEAPAIVSTAVDSLRSSLRAGLLTEEVADLMQEVLVEALAASRKVSTNCPRCSHRFDVQLPDLNTRVSAVSRLLDQLEGVARQSQESEQDALDREATKLVRDRSSLTDHELARYIKQLERELAEDS